MRNGRNPFTRLWHERLEETDQEYLARNQLWFGREPEYLEVLRDSVPVPSDHPAKCLEIGCGTGYSSLHLADAVGAIPFVVDISIDAIALVRRTFRLGAQGPSRTVYPVLADTLTLPFPDGAFDLVFSAGVLEHFRNPVTVLEEQARVVRPGGRLAVCVPQTFTIYTIAKRLLIAIDRWPCGWEAQFSARQLTDIGRESGLRVLRAVGSGYDRISRLLLKLPNRFFGSSMRHLERRFGHLFMKNLMVIFERPT